MNFNLPLVRRRSSFLEIDGATPVKIGLIVAVLAIVAVTCGAMIVAIGDLFFDRPIFYLALPLLLILIVSLVLDLQKTLVALVFTRAMFEPVFAQAGLPGIGGLGGLLNIGIIGLALMLAIGNAKKVPSAAWLPWVPLFAVMCFGVLRAPDKIPAIRLFATLMTYAAVYYSAFHCIKKEGDLERMLRWLLLSAIPVAVVGLVSYALFGPVYVLDAGETSNGRLSQPLGHPNILGFYFVVIAAAWLCKERARTDEALFTPRRIGWTLYIVVALGILAGTQARSAWFGAVILIMSYGFFVRRSYLVFLFGGALLSLALPEVRDRLSDLFGGNEVYAYSRLNSYAWRQYLWSSALAQISGLTYLLGKGTGAFFFDSIAFFPLAGNIHWNAHNVYVQILYDEGILGVVAYLCPFIALLRLIWLKTSLSVSTRVTGLTLLVAYAAMCWSDNMLDYLVVNWNFWLLAGFIAAPIVKPDAGPRAVTK